MEVHLCIGSQIGQLVAFFVVFGVLLYAFQFVGNDFEPFVDEFLGVFGYFITVFGRIDIELGNQSVKVIKPFFVYRVIDGKRNDIGFFLRRHIEFANERQGFFLQCGFDDINIPNYFFLVVVQYDKITQGTMDALVESKFLFVVLFVVSQIELPAVDF